MLGLSDDVLVIPAKSKITFVVRVVRKGDKYGKDWTLHHDSDELKVEFYDTRYSHSSWGQFVCRYYVASVIGRNHDKVETGKGLMLDGSVPDWNIDGETMDKIRVWIKQRALS